MAAPIEPIPEQYTAVTPMLIVEGANAFHEFLTAAFGAQLHPDVFRTPDDRVAHSELTIDGAVIMVSDATEEFPANTCGVHLYVADTDAVYQAALAAGASSKRAPENQFYGDRSAVVVDPHGNTWSIATHIEDVGMAEMMARVQAMFPQ